jgi:hypothetical protein
VRDHTYLLEEGRWEIGGSMIDVVGNATVMTGYAVVTHTDQWIVEEQINESMNRYAIVPPVEDRAATVFTGANGITGEVNGTLAFFDDLILSTYHSDDGHYSASEAFRRLDDDRYQWRGALFYDGGHVSNWSLEMRRV